MTTPQLEALREFDTPTICNAIELWHIRPRHTGYMNDSIGACFPQMPPMVGYALTSTFRSRSAPQEGDAYAGLGDQLDAFASLPGPPVVVFQDLDDRTAAATFGEVMCTTYQSFGASGLITSGTGRDLDQVEALGFPCFTAGTTCAHGYCHIVSVGTPVTVGGLPVRMGDLLHGDRNGVTQIPAEIVSELPDVCRGLMAAEQIVLDYVKSDGITPAGFREARAECSAQMEAISARLRGR